MHSLIGNSTSAKFIFFALDDFSSPPDEKKIKNLLGVKRINIYQRYGHYREQLSEINSYLFFKRAGIFESQAYRDNGFTHVVRLDAECELNVMIELAFGAVITGCLHLNDDLLKALHILLNDLSDLKDEMSSAERENARFLEYLSDIRTLKFMRNQLLIPQDQIVTDIFKDYALPEKQSIQQRFDEWYRMAQWKVNPIAGNDELSQAA